jgi:methyltransferase-like protein 23
MVPELELQYITIGNTSVRLFVPRPERVRAVYLKQKAGNEHAPFPYWAKLWPSAIALGEFILKHPGLLYGKVVAELAAGLGLPSFVAAKYAPRVCCSDYLPEAIEVINRSIAANNFSNVDSRLIDWNNIPGDLTPDVLLLSDINYAPQEFNTLQRVLLGFLNRGTSILLSSPHRLMAKTFVEVLLPWCTYTEEITTTYNGVTTVISVFVLKNPES